MTYSKLFRLSLWQLNLEKQSVEIRLCLIFYFPKAFFFGCKIKPTFITIIILIRFTFLINQFFVDHIYIKLFLYYIEDKNECIYQGNLSIFIAILYDGQV